MTNQKGVLIDKGEFEYNEKEQTLNIFGSEWWKVYTDPLSLKNQYRKIQVFIRSNFICFDCGFVPDQVDIYHSSQIDNVYSYKFYTGRKSLTIEHIVPKALLRNKNYDNYTRWNLTTLCELCNHKRSVYFQRDKNYLEWVFQKHNIKEKYELIK